MEDNYEIASEWAKNNGFAGLGSQRDGTTCIYFKDETRGESMSIWLIGSDPSLYPLQVATACYDKGFASGQEAFRKRLRDAWTL